MAPPLPLQCDDCDCRNSRRTRYAVHGPRSQTTPKTHPSSSVMLYSTNRTMNAAIVLLLLAQISIRPSPVEVVAPMPPTPVVAAGKRVLVYELHITNLGANALVLRHIEVSGFD